MRSCTPKGKGLREAFQELNCLLSWRRSLAGDRHPLDGLLRARMGTLHKRLKSAPKGPRTIYHWQTLYTLGTRLYPLQNRWSLGAKIPVYEVNGHHKALPFWIKESFKRRVGPLLHLDAHADMATIPKAKQVVEAVDKLRHSRDVKRAWHTLAHSIDNCAMPVSAAVLAGVYKRVIWGTPSWLTATHFLNVRFFFATPLKPNPLPPALRGGSHGGEGIERPPLAALSPRRSGRDHQGPRTLAKSWRWRAVFQLYLDAKDNPNTPLPPNSEYWHKISPKRRPHGKHFQTKRPLLLSVLRTDIAHRRDAKKLLMALPTGRFTLDLDLDYFASIDLDKPFMRSSKVFPRWDPKDFKRKRALLIKRLSRFRKLLQFLQKHQRRPALITIADSTFLDYAFDAIAEGQSEFTPLEHAAFLRRKVRAILQQVYGSKVRASWP